MKRKAFILFFITISLFAMSVILLFVAKIDFVSLIKDSVFQFGDFISSSISNVIRLIIAVAIMAIFLIFMIVSLTTKDRKYFKIFDVILFLVTSTVSIFYIHGSRENNLFKYFSSKTPILIVLAVVIVAILAFALSYTGIRLIFRNYGFKISIIVNDGGSKEFVEPKEQYNVSTVCYCTKNIYQHRFVNSKALTELNFHNCVKKLISDINKSQVLSNPKLYIQIKSNDLFYMDSLDKCVKYKVVALNGKTTIAIK